MSIVCIPRQMADKLKGAFARKEISIEDLYTMNSEERHIKFSEYLTEDIAGFINTNFEKAMVSNQKDSLLKWAQTAFTPAEKKSDLYGNVLDRINQLDKIGALNPESETGFLSDLVASKLGIKVTPEEVSQIAAKAKKLEELSTKLDPVLGIPDTEYWVARRNLDNYIHSLNPVHGLKVATSVIGRGTMLFSFKSPLTNIISNTVMMGMQGFERRIATGAYRGLNPEFMLAYVKKVNQIFQKSGYDISRLDALWPSQVRLGEEITHAQGAGAVRKVGRFYEDIVFKQLMGAPDVASSSIAFADSADLVASKIAKTEGLIGDAARVRSQQILLDAIKIQPESVEGNLVRAQAIADARYTTYTNKSGFSDVAMGIRKLLNGLPKMGNVRLGDQLMPFVKTPANVVSAAIDAAGVGAFKGFAKLPKAIKLFKAGEPALMKEAVRDFTTAGLGLTLATILAYSINPDDFVGDYDALSTKERELAALKNAPYNSIRVGDKWISLDYFGPLASAFVGIMYARKYGDTLPQKIAKYTHGAAGQLMRIPGLTELTDMIAGVQEAASSGDYKKTALGVSDELVSFIRSRVIPAITGDFARGLDRYERQTGSDIWSKTISGIPGLRQTLPPKISPTTGQPIESSGLVSTLLFGGRVRNAQENAVVTEIDRLYGENAAPAIRDIEKSSSRVRALHGEIGDDKFVSALQYYGSEYGKRVGVEISSVGYRSLTDEDKMKRLNSIRSDVMDDMILKYQKSQIVKPPTQRTELSQYYTQFEDYAWSRYPAELRKLSDEIRRLENSDDPRERAKGKQMLMRNPQVLSVRKNIAVGKKKIKFDYESKAIQGTR